MSDSCVFATQSLMCVRFKGCKRGVGQRSSPLISDCDTALVCGVTSVSLRCSIWNSVSFLWTLQRLLAVSSPSTRLTHTL